MAAQRSGSYNAAPTVARLTKAEIIELAKEKTAKKTWVTDLADRVGSHVKNQKQSSSYCWIHGPTRAWSMPAVIRAAHPLYAFGILCGSYQIKQGEQSRWQRRARRSVARQERDVPRNHVAVYALQGHESRRWKDNRCRAASGHNREEFEPNDHEGINSSRSCKISRLRLECLHGRMKFWYDALVFRTASRRAPTATSPEVSQLMGRLG
jgi:hypothetical protein